MKIAANYNEFVKIVTGAEINFFNTGEGQKLVDELLHAKLSENPNMTSDDWSKTKSEFLLFIFASIMKENKELMEEFGGHFYTELITNNRGFN